MQKPHRYQKNCRVYLWTHSIQILTAEDIRSCILITPASGTGSLFHHNKKCSPRRKWGLLHWTHTTSRFYLFLARIENRAQRSNEFKQNYVTVLHCTTPINRKANLPVTYLKTFLTSNRSPDQSKYLGTDRKSVV